MKKYIFLLFSTLLSFSSYSQCLEVTSIFVNACNETTQEGYNEMFTFNVGSNPLSVNDISVDWGTNNSFNGWCRTTETADSTDALNASILSGCGFLLEPLNDTIPAFASVLVVTSENFSVTDNSFAGLSDTMYIIFQCGNTPFGHFSNSANNTLEVTVSNSCVGTSSVLYNGSSLVGGDGATVFYDEFGNPTYVNNGCNAPVMSNNAFWEFTDEICQGFGDIDLNTLISPNGTTGGTWSGDGVIGNIFNPSGLLGNNSITYSVQGNINCPESVDSTITFFIDTIEVINTTEESCDSVFVDGNWFSNDTLISFTIPGLPPYGCETLNNVTIEISGAIIDSSYFFACDSIEVDSIWYLSSTILIDTISSAPPSSGNCDDLFISEYGEGSSNNKYIELYNGTGSPINLSNYSIELYSNGSATATSTQVLSGIIAPGDVFVISNGSSDPTILAETDLTSGTVNFNGDDAIALLNGASLIDLIGNIGCQTVWSDGSLSTQNNTIIRNSNYTSGVFIDPANTPCDFPTLTSTNWTSLGEDTWSNIGSHTANCGSVASGGCDTIVITTIEIAPTTVFDSIFLCTNEASQAGTSNDTLTSVLGCDSLITVTTTSLLIPINNNPINLSDCDSVNYNGTFYYSNTNLTDTILSILGCDSVFNEINIEVNEAITIQNPNNPIVICETNDSATLPDGNTVTMAGTYPVTFTNATSNGCDSTIFTEVITENCDLTCELDTALFESYEFTGLVPGIVPGATFQPNSQQATGVFAGRQRSGNNFLYMNIQNGYTGVVYSVNMDVCPGSEFNISFWIRQFDNNPGSNFDINIYEGTDNNAPLLSSQNIVNNGTTYNERVTPTLVSTSPIITFELVTIAPGGNGNDICFDDLLLEVCQLDTIVLPTETFCENENTSDLYDFISSVVGIDGTWTGPSILGNGFLGSFDPANSNSGTYFYTKTGVSACVDTVVQLEVNVSNTIIVQNPNNPIIICENNDSTLLADGTYANTAGTYPITFASSSVNGCDSTFVTVVETEICAIVCNNPFSLGPDQNLCFGESITLDAGSGYDTYEWQDGSENQIFTVNSSGTYYVTTNEIDFANNLVVNGDFEQGNTGFTTDYVVGTGGSFGQLSSPGTYAINTSPSNVHNNFANCGDNTSGNGNMYIANGSNIANTEVWCQNISISSNTEYLFSAWVGNALNDNNVAILQFSINGNQIGSDFSPSTIGCDWQQFSASWNSGSNTSAQICIVNQNTSGGGNDFILDDIFFTPFCIYSDTVEVQVGNEPTNEFNVSCTNIATEAGTSVDTIFSSLGCDSIYNNIEVTFIEPTENILSIACTNDASVAGTFTDTIFNSLGCDSVYNINQINLVNVATETFTLEGCDSVRIGGITYFEDFLSEDTIFSSLGCDSLIEVLDITVNESPIADAGEDASIVEGESTTLTASGGLEYEWNWPSGNSDEISFEVSPSVTTEYIVTVSENNCSDVDTVTIIVENSGLEVLIPNAFSPNNDGVNDIFQIVNAEFFKNIEMSIYNRWGELIHQGSGMNHGWDGIYRGRNQAIGVYIFYARATSTLTNETFILKGSVSLIR